MRNCFGCNSLTVDPDEAPRYDVLNPDYDIDNPQNFGPYCEVCFAETETGSHINMS